MKITIKDLEKIKPSKIQLRKYYMTDNIELIEDIKNKGIVTPILIHRNGEIIDGNRRYFIAKFLNIKKVPIKYFTIIHRMKMLLNLLNKK